MNNSIRKDTLREIKKSLGRFLSIFAIVAIGVAFFSGINVGSPDMKITADKYYDDYNFMDIQLISTLGFTNEDIKAINEVDGIKGIYPTYSMDVISNIKNVETVLRVHGLPKYEDTKNNENYINKVKIVEGRYPEKSNECLIENSKIADFDVKVGSKLKLQSGTDKDIKDSLKENEYTVVGLVETPYYLSYEKGNSNIGNGSVGNYIMIPQENFKSEVYTETFITINNAKEKFTYDDEYFDVVSPIKDKLEEVGKERSKIRYQEVIVDGKKKIADGKEQLKNKKLEAEKELNIAKNEIENSKKELELAQSELQSKQNEFRVFIENAENEIYNGYSELKKRESEYNRGYNEFISKRKEIEDAIRIGEEQIKASENGINELENKISNLKLMLKTDISEDDKEKIQEQIVILENILNESKEKLNLAKVELNSKKQMFTETESKLDYSKEQLTLAKIELDKNNEELITKKKEAENQFIEAQNKINNGKSELSKGQLKYEESKKKAEAEFLKAEKEINKSEEKLKDINEVNWYVLDRKSNYSFVDYEGSADRIEAIAKVFPLFFFLVAALVCLTTMTRMVDEQRETIGTLKALGYNKATIASKYILYAAFASVSGSILGIAIGFTVFPTIIFNAYGIMYSMPNVILKFNWYYATVSTVAAVLITTMAAVFACNKELKETPSILMRPKSPKNGKRIFLERIPFIWKRFSFTEKVTARNIFRYKKRFFMTVIGIAGCTALLLCGFGIKDSIKAIVDKQFGEIYKYDMSINIDFNQNENKLDEFKHTLKNDSRISDYMMLQSKNIKISYNDIEKDVKFIIPENNDRLEEFISMRNRKSKETLKLNEDGVIISEKIANQLNVKVADVIKVKDGEKEFEIKISGITEQYTFHYLYMDKSLYENKTKNQVEFNEIIAKTVDNSKTFEGELSKDIISKENVKSVGFNSGIKNNFKDTIASLNYVVLVMIVSAGALAFVVLYNLTNINISERLREIATIKVLGFYDNEVAKYVYRENIILTFIGIIVGLGLGVALHKYIMLTVELETIMFGRSIRIISYVYSFLLTFMFAIVVNFTMYYKLKKIQMVESLKSVD